MIFKHRSHLARRSGQQHNGNALVLNQHSGRAPVWIRKYLSFFDHHGLARVSFRHDVAVAQEALAEVLENRFVQQQATTESARGNFTRYVVLGWSQPSGGYYHLR